MKISPPVFRYGSSFMDNEMLVFHVGTPADGSGFVLTFHRARRTFDMYRLAFVDGSAKREAASAEDIAEAVALMTPEDIARCLAASIAA